MLQSSAKAQKHVALCNEWHLDYETPVELHQYYSTTQRKLYKGKLSIPLKTFRSIVLRHTASKLLWNFIVHDSLEKCLRMKCSIIVTMVNWNQLSMFLESVLYMMYNEITCKTFPGTWF